jgi:hypothetical protein
MTNTHTQTTINNRCAPLAHALSSSYYVPPSNDKHTYAYTHTRTHTALHVLVISFWLLYLPHTTHSNTLKHTQTHSNTHKHIYTFKHTFIHTNTKITHAQYTTASLHALMASKGFVKKPPQQGNFQVDSARRRLRGPAEDAVELGGKAV